MASRYNFNRPATFGDRAKDFVLNAQFIAGAAAAFLLTWIF